MPAGESDRRSGILPDMEESTLLSQQAQFRGQAKAMFKQMEEEFYHRHGRLVAEMPTDNGATLRRAVLADDCIKDLVWHRCLCGTGRWLVASLAY